jgi:uncharacterized protein DUF5615
MKVKLDENLGRSVANRFREAGHDVAMVHEQGMAGAADRRLIDVCRVEGRCLVSLDMDFANPFLFRPSEYAGIAVLRLPHKPSADDLFATVATLLAHLHDTEIRSRLWIVQPGRIRQHEPDDG